MKVSKKHSQTLSYLLDECKKRIDALRQKIAESAGDKNDKKNAQIRKDIYDEIIDV
jgi:hypothetical protein